MHSFNSMHLHTHSHFTDMHTHTQFDSDYLHQPFYILSALRPQHHAEHMKKYLQLKRKEKKKKRC